MVLLQDDKEKKTKITDADQLQKKGFELSHWMESNKFIVLGLLAIIVLCVFASAFFALKMKDKGQGYSAELASIDSTYRSEIQSVSSRAQTFQEKIKEIDEKLNKIKPDSPDAIKKIGLEAEKKAFSEKLTALKPDHNKSAALFHEYFKKNQTDVSGWRAGIMAASIFTETEKFADAKAILVDLSERSSNDSFYGWRSRLMLVGVLEQLGEYDDGIIHSDKLIKFAAEDLKPTALLAKARLQMLKSDAEAAKTTFSEIISKHQESDEAKTAKGLMQLL